MKLKNILTKSALRVFTLTGLITLFYFGLTSCKCGTDIPKKYLLAYGDWRGTFIHEKGGEIPFMFNITHLKNDSIEFTLVNGDERLTTHLCDIIGDSIICELPVYESVLMGRIFGANNDSISGVWIKTSFDKETKYRFEAALGGKYLFASSGKELPASVDGNWETTFIDSAETEKAVGTFHQTAVEVKGSFLTPTGDYRFLTGITEGDSLYLSGFDGASLCLVKAKVTGDKMEGMLYSGKDKFRKFTAVKNNSAQLEELTTEVRDPKSLRFSFPNYKNEVINFPSEQTKGKVVVLQILGTWCHNCVDETEYLQKFYNKYKGKGVEVYGLSFERTKMPEKARDNIRKLVERFSVTYPIVHAGEPTDSCLAKVFPQLKEMLGYPTTIILDKAGNVHKVSIGFSGPGTGDYYKQHIAKFESTIDNLLK